MAKWTVVSDDGDHNDGVYETSEDAKSAIKEAYRGTGRWKTSEGKLEYVDKDEGHPLAYVEEVYAFQEAYMREADRPPWEDPPTPEAGTGPWPSEEWAAPLEWGRGPQGDLPHWEPPPTPEEKLEWAREENGREWQETYERDAMRDLEAEMQKYDGRDENVISVTPVHEVPDDARSNFEAFSDFIDSIGERAPAFQEAYEKYAQSDIGPQAEAPKTPGVPDTPER